MVATKPAGAPERAPAPKPQEMSHAEATARGKELHELWRRAPRYRPAELAAWVASSAPPEAEVRAVVELLSRASSEKDAPALDAAIELLGEVGSTQAGPTATNKALLRGSAGGRWRAGSALERILERRLMVSSISCAPPSEEEIDRARDGLGDFLVVDRKSLQHDNSVFVSRAPTSSELDDLAYFYAALADTGAAVGTATEDETTPATSSAERAAMRTKIADARKTGDIEGHLASGLEYLGALGWPGPIRTRDDGDQRWGGAGFSYLMRELALSAELLGRYDLAESFYRRASWGGGACGTSAGSYRDDQIAGVVRAVELGRGCRGALAERLFAISLDLRDVHGPSVLADRGFDVARLYRAALLTRNRSDESALRAALASVGAAGLTRLDRLGKEDWMARVRAVPGFADTAGKDAVGPLVQLLAVGGGAVRRESLAALGALAQDRGSDPCAPSDGFGFLVGGSSSRHERDVGTVMAACETRIPKAEIEKLVDAMAKLASDRDPETREGVARALGDMATQRGRPVLQRLARDSYDSGGQVCTSVNGGPTKCQPNRPVRLAAEEALTKIAETERARAELSKRR